MRSCAYCRIAFFLFSVVTSCYGCKSLLIPTPQTTNQSYSPERDLPDGYVGDSLRTAMWQLGVALVFKSLITVFTFGLKVCMVILRLTLRFDSSA